MIARQGGVRSPHRYAGARVWVDYSKKGIPLRDCLYEYWGHFPLNDSVYHKFIAYRHKGSNFAMTDAQIMQNLPHFKPFIMDCVELGFVKQQGEYTDGPAS